MDRHLTRKGALNVTSDLDRIANTVQQHHEVLGIPERIASDFCWRCDVVADAIEKRAIANDKIHGIKEAAPEFSQPAVDDTGDSVEPAPGNEGFDANAIGDDRGGPYKQETDETYMNAEFTQQENHELRDRQQSGTIAAPDRMASLSRLAQLLGEDSQSELRSLSDRLKGIVARLEASKAQGIAPLVAGAKKQIAACDKLADQLITLDSTGEGSPELLLAADKVQTAVSEILPHLEIVEASSMDTTSPTALLEHEQLLADGSIVKLVQLAGRVTDEAMKSLGGEEKKKEASKKSEDEEASKKSEDEEKEAEESKESAKTADVHDLFAA